MSNCRIFCVLRSGGDFTVDDVVCLQRQIERHSGQPLFCLSDIGLLPPIQRIQLEYDWPGWWSKMELFRPDIEGDIFFLDLDMVIIGDIRPLLKRDRSTLLSDFRFQQKTASPLMYLKAEDRFAVWDTWMQGPEDHMKVFRGDQDFLDSLPFGQQAARWQREFPGAVIGYKSHLHAEHPPFPVPPEDTRIVCFWRHPRPSEVDFPWVLRERLPA